MKKNVSTGIRILLVLVVAGFASPRAVEAWNNCCETGHGIGCSDPVIEACVCAQDSWCCDVEWDGKCVTKVEFLGCGTCPHPERSAPSVDLLLIGPEPSP